MERAKVIAIDGPSGSGKSTIAKILAKQLNLTYLDTGAMFRAIAYKLKDLKIDFTLDLLTDEDEQKIEQILESMDFKYAVSESVLVQIDGEDLTQKIRQHEISLLTSHVSKFPVIRNYLKNLQRKIAGRQPSILDGRDIGTVIFPNAALKFFLTASTQARAERRYRELLQKDPSYAQKINVEQLAQDQEQRDLQDSQRAVAPLKKAEDAIEIDTTEMSIEDVCQFIKNSYQQKAHLFR